MESVKLSPDAEIALAPWQKSAKNLIEAVSLSPGFGRTTCTSVDSSDGDAMRITYFPVGTSPKLKVPPLLRLSWLKNEVSVCQLNRVGAKKLMQAENGSGNRLAVQGYRSGDRP